MSQAKYLANNQYAKAKIPPSVFRIAHCALIRRGIRNAIVQNGVGDFADRPSIVEGTLPAVSVDITELDGLSHAILCYDRLERRDVVHVTHRYTAQRTWLLLCTTLGRFQALGEPARHVFLSPMSCAMVGGQTDLVVLPPPPASRHVLPVVPIPSTRRKTTLHGGE